MEAADALETINGCSSRASNKRGVEKSKKINKPGIGGSDSHKIDGIGKVLTGVKSKRNILKQIKSGQVRIIRN